MFCDLRISRLKDAKINGATKENRSWGIKMEIVLRELKKASKKVYESNKKSAIPAKKNALVVSHELKRGGAPLV